MVVKFRAMLAAILLWTIGCFAALAQRADDIVWVQIEAQPNLTAATERAQDYAARLQDVNGFSLGRGWYGIALGPYRRADAEQVLRVYRAEGAIPSDSFIALPGTYGAQFWPADPAAAGRADPASPPELQQQAATPQGEVATTLTIAEEDETPSQARRSERALDAEARRALQQALRWAGFYDGAIDGAFGPGTRNAMSAWQQANGLELTGILTTRQRTALLSAYNAILAEIGLEDVILAEAGIAMKLPLAAVARDKTETPILQYAPTGLVPEARVLLISQRGDRSTLSGLYDILQTLEAIPLDGPRQRGNDSFSITGVGDRIVSEARVSLQDGSVKGFVLVWPAGDEPRRQRLLSEMEAGFTRLDGVLDPGIDATAAQGGDLLAGLEVRRPRVSRSGFFVDPQGTVVTIAGAVDGCARITLDGETGARVLARDAARGIAVLVPETALAPLSVGRFRSTPPPPSSEVAVAGYSFEGVLNAPTVTFGRLDDLKGLQGEEDRARLAMNVLPGDAGGPVLDTGGGVLGMLLPRQDSGRQLPENVQFAADSSAIRDVLAQAGAKAGEAQDAAPMDPADLTATATGMTVLVSCWD